MKCCPKQHTFVCEIGLGGRGGVTDEKGGDPGKGGGQDPLNPPPSGRAYVVVYLIRTILFQYLIVYYM